MNFKYWGTAGKGEKAKFFVLFLYLFYFGNYTAKAQVAGAFKMDTVKINIQDAEQQFVNKNLSIIAAKYNIDIAKANVIQARTWYNPNISYSQGLYDPKSKKYFDASVNGEADVQVHQLISIAGKHTNTVRLAKLDEQKSELVFQEVIRALKYELYQSLSDLYAAQSRLRLYTNARKNLELLITGAEQQLKLGSISGNEVIRLKTELQDIRNNAINGEQDLFAAQTSLKILLGYDYKSYLVVTELPKLDAPLPSFDQVLTATTQGRSDVLLAQKEVEYQKVNLKLQRSSGVPDLTIGTEYDHAASYVYDYWAAGLSMDLPLFNRNQGSIKAARIQVKQAQVLDSLQENTAKNEVIGAYAKLYKIKSELNTMDPKYLTNLEDLIHYAVENYEKRYISLLEFLDQMRTYTNAKLGMIDLDADYFRSVQFLNYTAGSPIIK